MSYDWDGDGSLLMGSGPSIHHRPKSAAAHAGITAQAGCAMGGVAGCAPALALPRPPQGRYARGVCPRAGTAHAVLLVPLTSNLGGPSPVQAWRTWEKEPSHASRSCARTCFTPLRGDEGCSWAATVMLSPAATERLWHGERGWVYVLEGKADELVQALGWRTRLGEYVVSTVVGKLGFGVHAATFQATQISVPTQPQCCGTRPSLPVTHSTCNGVQLHIVVCNEQLT